MVSKSGLLLKYTYNKCADSLEELQSCLLLCYTLSFKIMNDRGDLKKNNLFIEIKEKNLNFALCP